MGLSSAVDQSAVARVLGIKTTFKDLRAGNILFLPQRIAVIGQGASASTYSTDKTQYTSAFDVGSAYGFGSPLHLAAKQLFPENGDGVGTIPVTFYPLLDDGAGVAAAGDITPSGAATGSATYRLLVNNIPSEQFSVASGDTVADICDAITAAIVATLDLPILATDNTTDVGVTAKWGGLSGNALYLEIVATSEDNSGVTFAFTQPTGGAADPDISTATDQVGNVWETMILNCFDKTNTAALDDLSTFGEGRWGALVRKPFVAFMGNTDADVNTAIAVPDARKTDRVNSQLVSPGSNDLPLVVAARQLARIAVRANNNPPFDYGSLPATGLTPGADGDQWTYPERDQAVKGGGSTIEVKDGVVNLADVITFYHPSGDPIPAYRYVVDIVKLQNIIFNLDLIFATAEWDGAPLIPDDQPTINRDAKKPRMAVAAVSAMLDSLALNAIISDAETAKANTQAAINDQNPKRLDLVTVVQLSGNTNVKSIDLDFGFYFGTTPLAA
jgi:phage tail sheath gpL-like